MSLNRAVLALGAVAVVGVATVGASVAFAANQGKPVPNAAVTVGSTWTQIKPLCYNAGKALTTKQQTACAAKVTAVLKAGSAKTITVPSANSSFSINMDQVVTDRGWFAQYQGGALVPPTTKAYAGPLSSTTVLTSTSSTTGTASVGSSGPVLIVEGTGTNQNSPVYGEWLFQLKVKGA